MLYPYCAFPLWYLEHSRDITLLIVLLYLISCTTPACFRTMKYPLCFVVSYVRSISNQELFKKHLCNPHIPHLTWHRAPQLLSEKWSFCYASLSAMFNVLRSISNLELFEKHLCYQNNHYEKYGQFPLQREAITCYCQIDTFCCQQR